MLYLKKNDAPPASIVGIKFRGFVTGANKKGLDISTDMGGMSIPWVKVSDEQLGKLLAVLSVGIDVSYKIPIAIHLLGNTQEAFQLLYQRSLDNPLIMAKYSRFYFQTLFYFRKEMGRPHPRASKRWPRCGRRSLGWKRWRRGWNRNWTRWRPHRPCSLSSKPRSRGALGATCWGK